MKTRAAILSFACLIALPASAETANLEPTDNESFGFQQLFGEEMMDAYQNKTLEGIYADYAMLKRNNEEPATFTEFHHDNATTTYEHRGHISFTTTGVYMVHKDRMCYIYNDPTKVTGRFCFYVFERDNCYYHFSTQDPLPSKSEDFDNWTSMAYRHEDADTCLPDIS